MMPTQAHMSTAPTAPITALYGLRQSMVLALRFCQWRRRERRIMTTYQAASGTGLAQLILGKSFRAGKYRRGRGGEMVKNFGRWP